VQRFFSTGLLTAFSKAKEKIGFDKNPLSFFFDTKVKHVIGTKENPVHEVERNLSLIKHFTSDKPSTVKLYPSQEDYDNIKAIVKRQTSNMKNETLRNEKELSPVNYQFSTLNYICIAPSSVWFTKQYPKEKWIEFLQQIPNEIKTFLIGAASDKILCDEIKNALPERSIIINLCGELSLLESAALMQNANMNYVNDSAPMHIASAMNAPVTAVFCSTVAWFGYTPLSYKSFVVEKKEPLYCRPCTTHGRRECPEKHFKCALDIKKEQLLVTLNNE
jgi:heptosyltransferase-2